MGGVVFEKVTVGPAGEKWLDGINLSIRPGEQWAIVGPSGSGKTVLAHTLLGRHYYTGRVEVDAARIAMVEQMHRFRNLSGTSDLYYQQRFNSYDAEQTITVREELRGYGIEVTKDARTDDKLGWIDDLHIRHLLDKPLIQLSNGENRRVQLAIALCGEPTLLILDNPFLGLDKDGRLTLHHIINRLATKGVTMLVITSAREILQTITHVAEMDAGRMIWKGTREAFIERDAKREHLSDGITLPAVARRAAETAPGDDFAVAVKLAGVTVRYGETTILNKIDWEVRKGELWGLSGPNGAGKSTILSLITADNPQAYANEVWLFDRRRGTGESIWDIKRRIGLVSPELHLYFEYSATCFEVIASGLFDTIGLFRAPDAEQRARVDQWMGWLGLDNWRDKRLNQLAIGQQRMVLLARALVKDPALLILDEPCQGMDEEQTERFMYLIDQLCIVPKRYSRTLIYVSHYRDDTPSCVDSWLRIEGGRVVR